MVREVVDVFGQIQVVHAGGVRRSGDPGVQEVGQARNDRVDVREHLFERSGIADVQDGRAFTRHLALVGVDLAHLKPPLDEHVGDQSPNVAEADDRDPIDGLGAVANPWPAS